MLFLFEWVLLWVNGISKLVAGRVKMEQLPEEQHAWQIEKQKVYYKIAKSNLAYTFVSSVSSVI